MEVNHLKLFINYRRSDTSVLSKRIYDFLSKEYGFENVFMDVDSIVVGDKLNDTIRKYILRSDVVLSVVGSEWVKTMHRKSELSEVDFVRTELEIAHSYNRRIMPLIANDNSFPLPEQLPNGLEFFADLAFYRLSEYTFDVDMQRINHHLLRVRENPKLPHSNDAFVMRGAWIICLNCGNFARDWVPEGRACPLCRQPNLWLTNKDPANCHTLGELAEIAQISISI